MKDTENREEWYREGEEREKDFLKLYGDKLGLILNPCKNLDKTALDFFNKREKMLSD